jgi:hypothetical protein
MVAMVTIVMNHVMDVYLIPVIKNMVSVQIHLDVNLDGNTGKRSVIYVCSGNYLLLPQNNKQKQMNA